MYKLICMSFDGEYVTERNFSKDTFESIEAAWEHANDMGSKWYFYPFCFVVNKSGKTIVAAPSLLEHFVGQRVKTVARQFAQVAAQSEAQGLDSESFAFALMSA